MKYLLLSAALLCSIFSQAQLPDGSIAPDFTITDIDGFEHNLYGYLDAGTPVILLFESTWNVPGWNYASTGALNDLYNINGPAGTNEAMVIMLEADDSTTGADLDGTGTNTQGDWVSLIDYPIVDDALSLFNTYQNGYYPTIYTICPNRILTESGQLTYLEHLAIIQAGNCEGASLSNNPALFEYTGETAGCGSLNAEVTLMNLGVNSLTSADITMTGCLSCPLVENWTGSLATYGTEAVSFPNVTLAGDATLTFTITSPNDDVTDDVVNQNVTDAISATTEIHIDILTDCWPEENTWQISQAGVVVASGGPYLEAATVFNEVVNLGTGCFQFTFFDSYGDGLNGTNWPNDCTADGSVLVTAVNPDQSVFSTIWDYDGSTWFSEEVRNFDTCGLNCPGCTDSTACNFDPQVLTDDGSCVYGTQCGCTDSTALNYSSVAVWDDGSCTYPPANYGSVTDILGTVYDLDAIAASGQKILFHFLADWNQFDVLIAPDINAIYTNYGCNLGDVFVVGVNQQGNNAVTQAWGATNSFLPPLVSLEGGAQALFDFFNIGAYPTVVLADASFVLEADVYAGWDGATSNNFDLLAPTHSIFEQPCDTPGCMDTTACNFMSGATVDDGSCDYSCLAPCTTIGSPLWSLFGTGVYPEETTTLEYGVSYTGELLFNLAESYTDPASGNVFDIVSAQLVDVTNLPLGIDVTLPGTTVPSGTQVCLPVSGTPALEGEFEAVFQWILTIDVFGNALTLDPTNGSHFFQVDPNVNGIGGCTYAFSPNYNPIATFDDGSCTAPGLADACGPGTVWDPIAGLCIVDPSSCVQDLNYDLVVNTTDMLIMLSGFGTICEE